MGTETLQSAAIIDLDKSPANYATAGEGAVAHLKSVSATVSPTDGKTVGSIYAMVRIPVTAKIKRIYVGQSVVAIAFVADIGLYYSDSKTDGTAVANQGVAIDTDFFVAAKDFDAALLNAPLTDITFLNPTSGYLVTDANLPIWNATNSGLTVSPGGFFDICLTTVSETNSVPGTIYMEVQYTE